MRFALAPSSTNWPSERVVNTVINVSHKYTEEAAANRALILRNAQQWPARCGCLAGMPIGRNRCQLVVQKVNVDQIRQSVTTDNNRQTWQRHERCLALCRPCRIGRAPSAVTSTFFVWAPKPTPLRSEASLTLGIAGLSTQGRPPVRASWPCPGRLSLRGPTGSLLCFARRGGAGQRQPSGALFQRSRS